MQPASKEAYRLFHEGALALSRMEQVGMPVNVAALDNAILQTNEKIKRCEAELRTMPEYELQRRKYGARTNLGSRDQLADVLFNVMGHPNPRINPETGNLVLDDDVLREIDSAYTRLFQRTQKLAKLRSTYLLGIRKEVSNGRVHGFFNLHTVVTYRGSSDSPNLQNIPVRDPDIGSVIRSAISPTDPNNVIVEIDYSTLEVVIGACLHGDPAMADHLITGFDFHRATAQECFFMDDIPKPLRQLAKITNFSLIYGDYYAAIALKLWKGFTGLTKENSKVDGNAVLAHLASKGITKLGDEHNNGPGTFTGHVKGVCDRFWDVRFPTFARWRQKTWNDYQTRGYLFTKTGFRVHGVYRRNEILNVETQGCAFHCLLQSVIDITKELIKRKFKARLICQIHDSLLAEVPRTELDEYIAMATYLMTEGIRSKWSWVTLPLSTEVEVGDNWAAKKPYTIGT